MRYGRLTAVAIALASLSFAQAALAQQKTAQSQIWEYKIINYCDPENQGIDEREMITYLGEDGWELVSADTRQASETERCLVHYFKRPQRAEPKQIVNRPPQCSIPLDKAPVIRGLRLGMSADEVLSIIAPGNNSKSQAETAIKDAGLAPNYGLAIFTLYPRNAAVMEAKEKFAGINRIGFKTFDGRVVEIKVVYAMRSPDLYPSWTIDEWTAKVSSSFGLPGPDHWEPSPIDDQRTLKCKGLEIEAAINPPVYASLPVLGIYRTPSLTIIDPSYRQILDQRAKSDQEQKQREFVF
ncbi:MAG TPA: hypothetical protein VIM99_09670 [Blastocatellia bacterium]